MRRRQLLAWLTGLTLAAALLAPTAAAAAETETTHFGGTESRIELNPCSGAVGTLTIVFSGVMTTTQLEDGVVHMTVATTGMVTFIPDDPGQVSYTGHLAELFGATMHSRNSTLTNAENVVPHGSDGSLGKQHILFHLTVNANGTVTSSIDITEFTC